MSRYLVVWKDAGLVVGIFTFSTLLLAVMRAPGFPDFPLFEEIILCAIFSTLIFFVIMNQGKNRTQVKGSRRTIIHVCLIGFLSTIVILPNTLLNIDRSRSFYVLSWIDNNKVVENGEKLELSVNSPEASVLPGVKLRIDEQVKRGLISRTDSGLELTTLGKFIVVFSRNTARIFSLSNWEKNNS